MLSQNSRYFFDEIPLNEARLNATEKKRLTKKSEDRMTKSVKLIKVKNLRDLPNGDLLTIPISGEREPLIAEALKYQYYGDEDFTWAGKLRNKTGYFAFVSKPEGGKMGFIQFDNRFFLLQPLNRDICMLVEQDVQKYENVQINGVATGTVDNDNARVIRNTGCIASNFRQSEMSIMVYSEGCLEGQETFGVQVTPSAIGDLGQAPFQYDWYTSVSIPFDPNNASYIGSGTSISVNSPSFGYFWIHVKVTSSDGVVKIASHKVYAGCFQEIAFEDKNKNIDIKQNLFEVSPNPSQGIFNLEINMSADRTNSTIEMTDLYGKVIQTIQKGALQQGYHQFKIDLSQQQNGFYLCKIQTGNQFQTLKIVKL